MKFVAAAVLLCVTGFCVFGFLASFEAGWFSVWHCLYGFCGIGSLAGAMHLLLRQTLARTMGALALFAGVMICVLRLIESYYIYFPWQSVGAAALGCGLLTGGVAILRRRGDSSKSLGALALFAMAVFCVLGFIESYLRSPWPWQAGYGVLGCGFLSGGIALVRPRGGFNQRRNQ